MKKVILILLIVFTSRMYGQIEVSAGMGFNVINSPIFTEYVNTNFAPPGNRIADFNGAVEFYGELGYNLNDKLGFAIDYSNVIYSFNTASYVGNYDISYLHIKPSLLAYYLVGGEGYQFKFGGGIGPRFVSLDEKMPNLQHSSNYKSTGFGFVLRASGNTLLSEDMYANIAVDFRYDISGNPEGEKKLYDSINKTEVTLNGVTFAVKLGITYLF